jgi:hypothetical protein
MKALLTMAAFVAATTLGACASSQATLEPAEPAVEGKADKGPKADSKTEEIPEGSEATSEGSEEAAPEAAPRADNKKEQTPEDCADGETWVEAHEREGKPVKGHCRKKPKPE